MTFRTSRITIDWSGFKDWITKKYSRSHAPTIWSYARRFSHLLTEDSALRELDTLKGSTRNTVIKSLKALARYLGVYDSFTTKLRLHDIKYSRVDSFTAFLRLFNNNLSDLRSWFRKAQSVLDDSGKVFLEFCLLSGFRKSEALRSFNLIIQLTHEGRLLGYYNNHLSALEHFKFKDLFLRGKKNCYLTFIPYNRVLEISKRKPISSESLRKRLSRNSLPSRIQELRDYFATFMVKHGLIKEEVDLLQGRIPPNIFIRSYFSPSLTEIRDRTLKALKTLEREGWYTDIKNEQICH